MDRLLYDCFSGAVYQDSYPARFIHALAGYLPELAIKSGRLFVDLVPVRSFQHRINALGQFVGGIQVNPLDILTIFGLLIYGLFWYLKDYGNKK